MMELLTAAQMRAIERTAIESGQVTGLELMERAGAGVVEAILETWPELHTGQHRAAVLCGPGNNGGDGFVVARLLELRGWEVKVNLYGDPARLPPDARTNFDRLPDPGAVLPLTAETTGAVQGGDTLALVVDALFGTGLTRPFNDLPALRQKLNALVTAPDRAGQPRVVSVDLPSGLCADSGRYLANTSADTADASIAADLTVTFHRVKIGHYLAEGPAACGKLVLKDIGL